MKLFEDIIYEQMGFDVYINLNNETFILNNEVSVYIFNLLQENRSLHEIQRLVNLKFDSIVEFTNDEKNTFVCEFIQVLQEQGIVI